MKYSDIYIKNRARKSWQFQYFMHQFVESGIRNGMLPLKEHGLSRFMQRILNRILSWRCVPTCFFPKSPKKVIITSRGGELYTNAFPYYGYEIIPMLWDVWPSSWSLLYRDLRMLRCKQVFVTSRYMAEKLEKDLGIQAYWIPEGIDIADYDKGGNLEERPIDIYELGRQHKEYNKVLGKCVKKGIVHSLKRNEYDPKSGALLKLAYPTAKDLIAGLNQIKIVVSFPHIDTHPNNAGPVETLTQRYWEAMLSRCLIIGRAPKELVDFIGYNPVIEVDWEHPEKQLSEILKNICEYQKLTNKNYDTALKMASWDNRIITIKSILSNNNIKILK